MTTRQHPLPMDQERPQSALEFQLARLLYIDGEKLAYAIIFIFAVLTRFWDLGARVMSHDESLHTRYSWNLYRGDGFSHTPLMHGPLLFHMTALSYLLFGDNDFTARIYPALLGVCIVMLPYLMRRWLGKWGALAASTLFLISPLMTYYSRYIRHDIPAIFAALVIAVAAWYYLEDRKSSLLLWIAGAQSVLFASKEVSFIYIAIFGSFLTLYFLWRLLDVKWESRTLYTIFIVGLLAVLLAVAGLGVITALPDQVPSAGFEGGTIAPLDPTSGEVPAVVPVDPINLPQLIVIGVLAVGVITLTITVLLGQWRNLRRFPELDIMIVMGSLLLPALTPFVMHFTAQVASRMVAGAGDMPAFVYTLSTINPMDETATGVTRSALFTAPVLLISVIAGAIWGLRPPTPHTIPDLGPSDDLDGEPRTIEVQPNFIDWLSAFFTSRWWPIAAIYWLIFVFFFTTMFTNGAGLGTGVIGSLGYWLEQQDVKRGGQPWYYYLLVMMPIYEYLPLILAFIAGLLGLGSLATRIANRLFINRSAPAISAVTDDEFSQEADAVQDVAAPPPPRPWLDLDAPIHFPILLFTGYWAVCNLVAYSLAGEKMPWLTTHLTTPMILLGGWVVGRLLQGIDWSGLQKENRWLLLILLPLLGVTFLRVIAPTCNAIPFNLLCNSIVPTQYEGAIFEGQSIAQISATYAWIFGVAVFFGVAFALVFFARRSSIGQLARLAALWLVAWLAFSTAQTSWRASFVNYDNATEYLVYAHSAGAVKEVLNQIEEISLKTTDGYGLRVAYDNRVSWPYSWYLRNYYNAVYYGDQPSRGLLGDAPVILAGPDNWNSVESLLGDRYYQFEYIRMWWPMQDYFNLRNQPLSLTLDNLANDPALQRGVWDIVSKRDYDAYGEAVGRNYELSQWPVAERMRLYIRKDTFAQVWDYGVAASEIAEAVDPYAANQQQLSPAFTFGTGLLNRPHGLALGPDGLIYVADSNNHRIAVFDADGTLVRSFGEFGLAPAPAVLNEPWDVSVAPDGTVYVADTWNHRVVEYSPEGEYVKTWGFEGPNELTNPAAFWGPRGIGVDARGFVYVADTGNKRIQVFDDQHFFDQQIGSGGFLDGQVDEPAGVAFDVDGNLYIADTWNQRIDVFSPDGVFLRQWPIEGWFAQSNERPYIAIDPQGNVYVTDPEAFRVIVFDTSGQYLYSFGDFTTINLVGGIAVDEEGHLYIADTSAGVIQRYDVSFFGQPAQ